MKSLLDRIPISKQKPGDNKVQKKKVKSIEFIIKKKKTRIILLISYEAKHWEAYRAYFMTT